MMDLDTKKVFDEIVAKEPVELNSDQVAFLRARRSYLNADQLEKFAEILEGVDDANDSGDGLEDMSVNALKALAEEKKVNIDGLKKKVDIISAIRKSAE